MKIAICGSMKLSKKMVGIKKDLKKLGHKVLVPLHAEKYAEFGMSNDEANESTKRKIEQDLIRDYFNKIGENDALLVVNESLKEIDNYIGGNSFLEIGFAHVLDKKIFLLNPIPEIGYKDEILAMQPIILNGDLSKIK